MVGLLNIDYGPALLRTRKENDSAMRGGGVGVGEGLASHHIHPAHPLPPPKTMLLGWSEPRQPAPYPHPVQKVSSPSQGLLTRPH